MDQDQIAVLRGTVAIAGAPSGNAEIPQQRCPQVTKHRRGTGQLVEGSRLIGTHFRCPAVHRQFPFVFRHQHADMTVAGRHGKSRPHLRPVATEQ